MRVNYYVNDDDNFEVNGTWMDIRMTRPDYDYKSEHFDIFYKAFVTYDLNMFGDKVSGVIGLSPCLENDRNKSFHYALTDYLQWGDHIKYVNYDIFNSSQNNRGSYLSNGNLSFY